MNYINLLMLKNGKQSFVTRAYERWEDAQATADKFNEICLKENLAGFYYVKVLVVE